MIKLDKTVVSGFSAAIRGMRNAKNSWDRADSVAGFYSKDTIPELIDKTVTDFLNKMGIEKDDSRYADSYKTLYDFYHQNCILSRDSNTGIVDCFVMGGNDLDLASTLAKAGTDHGKFLRQIQISVDITVPLFWWKAFDTYKVGTVANSTSTMHTITNNPITMQNFSFDVMLPGDKIADAMCDMITVVNICEDLRKKYLEVKAAGDEKLAKEYWRLLIEILPNGWLQTRTVTLNYAVAKNIYNARHGHKLKEWHTVCDWIAKLPYAKELILAK